MFERGRTRRRVRRPKNRRGMDGNRDNLRGQRGELLRAVAGDPHRRTEQPAGCRRAERHDDSGPNVLDFKVEPQPARHHLFMVRSLVDASFASCPPFEVLHHVGQIDRTSRRRRRGPAPREAAFRPVRQTVRPGRSSTSPGCSPTSMMRAADGPAPNTVCVGRSLPQRATSAGFGILLSLAQRGDGSAPTRHRLRRCADVGKPSSFSWKFNAHGLCGRSARREEQQGEIP